MDNRRRRNPHLAAKSPHRIHLVQPGTPSIKLLSRTRARHRRGRHGRKSIGWLHIRGTFSATTSPSSSQIGCSMQPVFLSLLSVQPPRQTDSNSSSRQTNKERSITRHPQEITNHPSRRVPTTSSEISSPSILFAAIYPAALGKVTRISPALAPRLFRNTNETQSFSQLRQLPLGQDVTLTRQPESHALRPRLELSGPTRSFLHA